jgi:UDP-N-acetylglucosamine--N-acetylmuramyl-(pentapeptide) pyrophosphoryl-undecaprenol N-acetylglucosamine transferase
MRVLITGGGTGGHVFPALAIADALKNLTPAPEILFVGSATGLEATAVPQAGYPFRGLPAMSLPRRFSFRLIRAGFANLRSVLKAREIVDSWKPDVVFATGGFASAAVLVAGWMARVPVVLHEQNAVPGLTNRIASRFAREVHLTYSASRYLFPRRGHLRLSGVPLREGILQGSRGKALRLFRLEDDRRTVLVFGGSQGAHRLNEAVADALPRFAERRDVQFVIQAGQKDHAWMLERCRGVPVRTWVRPFILNMGDAYAVADLVVCRAGALTLAELAATGRPSILVPYPHATANHQTLNAEIPVDAGAAILIPDGELTGELLAERITELIDEPRRLRMMSIQSMKLAKPDATDRIVHAIRRIGEGPGPVTEPEEQEPPAPRHERERGPRRRPRGAHVAHPNP